VDVVVVVVVVAAAIALRPERRMKHRIVIAREQYKFSCAHMTVFPDGTKERLHGHNYTIAVAIDVDSVALDAMIPFTPIKQALSELCAAYKERVLLGERNPHFKIVRDDGELEFMLCGDRYVLPRGDALLLPIDNISVEQLAQHIAAILKTKIAVLAAPQVRALEVTVEESPGQGSSCTLELR
jgi:6-pyruvoyltetrahydropterin/6-carboxytetrahydropterin synthase